MAEPRRNRAALSGALALALAACGNASDAAPTGTDTSASTEPVRPANAPKLGLMTSLPLYWPLGADMGEIASGAAAIPWQRRLLEYRHELVPLDTLSSIPALSPDDPDTDPLEGLERLAVIQPRGLSPADNVALDDWVRAGGQLLLVLDPMLTGHYDLALGDPRRPVDSALIPPVVARWGMKVAFNPDEPNDGSFEVPFSNDRLTVFDAGEIDLIADGTERCEVLGQGAIARCEVGAGSVVLLADAGMFEHELIVERQTWPARQPVVQLVDFAFPEQ